jgi:hypothetical protein
MPQIALAHAITRNSSSIATSRAASPLTGSRSANQPPFRHAGSWRRENLPVPIVHDPEALRADLSVPSRTRWRPCESARPSKSPGRSANHLENRCTIGAHDTVEFESPLQAAPKSGAPHRHNPAAPAGSSPKSHCFYRMSIVHCSSRRAPSEQFRTCPLC